MKARAIENLTAVPADEVEGPGQEQGTARRDRRSARRPEGRASPGCNWSPRRTYEPAAWKPWRGSPPTRNAPLDVRREAVRTLGEFKVQQAIDALAALQPQRGRCGPMRSSRLSAMVRSRQVADPAEGACCRTEKSPVDLRREAVAALARHAPGTIWLARRAREGRAAEGTGRRGRPAAPQLRTSRICATAHCSRSPRPASSTRRSCPPSPNSRSAPATRPAARPCGTPASPARRSARSATWSAASAGRSAPICR